MGDLFAGSSPLRMRPRGARFSVTFLLLFVRNVTLLLFATFFFLSTTPAFSQSTAPVWERLYGSGAAGPEDRAFDATTDADGNLYVTGYSAVTETQADFLTVKFDADGNVLWSARYDEEGFEDKASAIALGPDGSVYVTGHAIRAASGLGMTTVKYDWEGNQVWAVHAEGDRGLGLVVGEDGSAYVYAYHASGDAPSSGLVKYDTEGRELWESRFEMDDFFWPNLVMLDAVGNIYVTGKEWEGNDSYALIMKYAPDGRQLWRTSYRPEHGTASVVRGDVAVDGEGNLFVSGLHRWYGAFVAKYDANGKKLWERFDRDLVEGRALAVDGEGSVYVTGGDFYSKKKHMTAKYDAEGNWRWRSLISQGYPSGIIVGEDGKVYVSSFFTPASPLPFQLARNPTSLAVEAFDAVSGQSQKLEPYDGGLQTVFFSDSVVGITVSDPTPIPVQSGEYMYLIGAYIPTSATEGTPIFWRSATTKKARNGGRRNTAHPDAPTSTESLALSELAMAASS